MHQNRREFIQTGVAVFAALGIPLQLQAGPALIDLSRFCDAEMTRYSLAAPFVRDGWVYATDTRILVRVKEVASVVGVVVNPGRVPTVEILPELQMFDDRGWRPWPTKKRVQDLYWDDATIQSLTSSIHISGEYDDVVRTLPEVQWKPGPPALNHPSRRYTKDDHETFSVLFRSNGVQGVLCTLNNDGIEESLKRNIRTS